MEVPHSKTGYMDFCCCAIYDGNEIHLGFSQAFECPPSIMKVLLEEGQNLTQACHTVGLTTSMSIGQEEGIIGILTRNRVPRLDYTKQAIMMALIPLENPEWYKRER